ncbi:MAG: glycosyltransferase [Lachnospiraceae bacterium]|nr:glycosyltransferase [Lachnospiraceae bacterium]
MRILYILWESYGTEGIIKAFRDRGDAVDSWRLDRTQDMRLNNPLAEKLIRHIAENKYDMVFSYNYFPVVSLACNACKVRYAAWIYDSPLVALYSNTINFPYNYVFVFDRGTYYDLVQQGVNTVYYLPLACDVEKYDSYPMDDSIHEIYDRQVTFVGSTYMERKNQLYKKLQGVNPYVRGYLEGIMQAQKDIYGEVLLEKMLTPEIMEEIDKVNHYQQNVDGFERSSWVFAHYHLSRHIAGLQRREILGMVSEKYPTTLYTYEKTPWLPNIENRGTVGYNKEAIYVFRCSKINLNITLKSIITGIPLRAFEIMGSGGFLLSNYQADFLDYFVPGEDFAYFDSNEDLMAKIEYYLTHEKERQEVARNGYEKVKKYHTYRNRVEEIIGTLFGE